MTLHPLLQLHYLVNVGEYVLLLDLIDASLLVHPQVVQVLPGWVAGLQNAGADATSLPVRLRPLRSIKDVPPLAILLRYQIDVPVHTGHAVLVLGVGHEHSVGVRLGYG